MSTWSHVRIHLIMITDSLSLGFVCVAFLGSWKEGSVIHTLIGISPPKDPRRGV